MSPKCGSLQTEHNSLLSNCSRRHLWQPCLKKLEKLKELITPIAIDPTENSSPELDLLLKDYIDNIAAIIYYQSALKEQDNWMKDMIREGYYNPDCAKDEATEDWPCFCVECLG